MVAIGNSSICGLLVDLDKDLNAEWIPSRLMLFLSGYTFIFAASR